MVYLQGLRERRCPKEPQIIRKVLQIHINDKIQIASYMFCNLGDYKCTILHIVGSKRYTALIASYAYDIITIQVYKVASLVLSTILLVQSEKYFLLSTISYTILLYAEKS